MSEVTLAQLPLAPASISVQGPARGRYDLMHPQSEQDRYIVRVDGITVSTTIDIDRSYDVEGMDWSEKIRAIAEDAKRWIGSSDSMARTAAVHEWINRDDPEDERLCAIELAQIEFEAQNFVRTIRSFWPATQKRVIQILQGAS